MRKAKLFSLVFVPIMLISMMPIAALQNKVVAEEQVMLNVPYYNQNDPAQAPNCYYNGTNLGCTVTSTAMVLKYYGLSATPQNVFAANGYSCYMNWGSLDYSKIQSNPPSITFQDLNGASKDTIKNYIRSGYPVIIGNDNYKGRGWWHWVVVKGFIGDTFYVNNPAGGFEETITYSDIQYAKSYQGPVPISGTPFFQTIRGTDNQIYSRVTTNGTSWSSWSPVGTTYDDISSIQFNGVTYQSIRGTNNAVYIRRSSGTSWGPWEYYGGSTTNDVNMEVFNGRLYQAIKGTNDFVHYRSTTDGVNWNAWELGASANITWSDVAMETSNGQLFQAIRGTDEYVYFRKTSGIQFMGGWTKTSIRTDDDITLKDYNGLLYMAAKGKNNEAFLGTYDPAANNFSFTNIGTTRGSIALEVHAGLLYQSYRD